MNNPVIVIVEDDIDQQQNYAESLQSKGFETHCFSNVADGLEGIQSLRPDLVLLDVVLQDDPDGGFTICRKLLDQGTDVPVIFLTDRSEEIDQVFGLRLGAWDYQTKPISLALLAERVKALLRIYRARRDDIKLESVPASAGSALSIDMEKSYVAWHGDTIPLTLTEFRLLTAIRDAGAQGITYQDLSESTMQRMVTNGTINSHVKNMRKKFNATGNEFSAIRNKPGFGYRWEAP